MNSKGQNSEKSRHGDYAFSGGLDGIFERHERVEPTSSVCARREPLDRAVVRSSSSPLKIPPDPIR